MVATSHHGLNKSANQKALAIALALTSAWFVIEVVGGLVTNSLALLADAGHMLSDVGAISLALFALWYGSRPATPTKSYGYYRTETLAALINGSSLFLIAIYITWESIRRVQNIQEVNSALMMLIAVGGLAINLIAVWLLSRTDTESLNVRAAFLHVVGDALGSVAAIIAGAMMLLTGWFIVDSIVSLLIAVIIIFSGFRLLRQTLNVLLEGVPENVDLLNVRDAMRDMDGIDAVHDLHIWTLTTGCVALSAHATLSLESHEQPFPILIGLRHLLKERFGVDHVTVQLESHDLPDEDTHVGGDPRCLA